MTPYALPARWRPYTFAPPPSPRRPQERHQHTAGSGGDRNGPPESGRPPVRGRPRAHREPQRRNRGAEHHGHEGPPRTSHGAFEHHFGAEKQLREGRDTEILRRFRDHRWIVGKEPRELIGEEQTHHRHRESHGAHDARADPSGTRGARRVAGPEALPDDGGECGAHPDTRDIHHALHTEAEPEGRERRRTELRGDAREQYVDETEDHARGSGRRAHAHDRRKHGPSWRAPHQHTAPAQNHHARHTREAAWHQRSQRGPAHAERRERTEAPNEERIEDEAAHGGHGEDPQRRARVASRAECGIDGKETEDERHPQEVRAKVVATDTAHIPRCAEQLEEPRQHERGGHRDRTTQQQSEQEAVSHATRRILRPSLAVAARGDGIESDAHHLADGNHQPHPEHGARDGRQGFGPE